MVGEHTQGIKMKKQTRVIILTVLVWILISIIYAYFYVTGALSHADLKSYESEWQFQLLMFALYRLPLLIFSLATIIILEIKYLKKKT